MTRKNFSSGTKWEPVFGYSRAVQAGPYIHVSGTTATGAGGEIVGRDDVERQARQCNLNIEAASNEVGSSLSAVVRTRTHAVNISDGLLIEMEADAYLGESDWRAPQTHIERP